MNKEQIFTNMKDIQNLPNSNPEQEIDITPQEVLDYFTNNSEQDKANAAKKQNTSKIINDKGDVELTISREEWKAAGLDEATEQKAAEIANPAASAPIPEIYDPTITNSYTNELFYSKITATTQEKMLYDLSKVTIDDDEKEYYLRTVLENEPLELFVTIGEKARIGFMCRSKTIEIQNLITALADSYITTRDSNSPETYKHNTFECGMYMLKLNAMFCIQSQRDIYNANNTKIFVDVPIDASFEEQQILVKQNIEIIDKMSFAKWNLILNAMRIFEQKEVLLGANLVSGDF